MRGAWYKNYVELTVSLSVHHNGSLSCAVGIARCESIVALTLSNQRGAGGESSRLRCEGTGRSQQGGKTKDSHREKMWMKEVDRDV